MHLPAKANSLTVQTFMANKSLSDSDSDSDSQTLPLSGQTRSDPTSVRTDTLSSESLSFTLSTNGGEIEAHAAGRFHYPELFYEIMLGNGLTLMRACLREEYSIQLCRFSQQHSCQGNEHLSLLATMIPIYSLLTNHMMMPAVQSSKKNYLEEGQEGGRAGQNFTLRD